MQAERKTSKMTIKNTKIFCINLDRRTDKMIQFIDQASKYSLVFERISAVDGLTEIEYKNPLNLPHFSAGDIGCTLSHLKVVKRANELNLSSYIVLEDDALFRPGFSLLYQKFLNQVPDDWDLIYFGANHNNTKPKRISENVVKVNGSFTTHAMMVSCTMYDALIEKWSNPIKNVDVLLSELHDKFNCYCFYPNLVGQRQGFSDILNKDVNYDFLLK